MQGGHAVLGLDGADTGGSHTLAVKGILDATDATPIPPVDRFDWTGPGVAELVREGIFEGAAGGVVTLTRCFKKSLHSREEENKVKGLVIKDLGEAHADVHLGGEPGAEACLVHVCQRLVEQDNGGVDHTMNVAVGGLDLFKSSP